jgi:hypothetical protein
LHLASHLLTLKPLLDFWWALIFGAERQVTVGEYHGSEVQLPPRGDDLLRARALRVFEKIADNSGDLELSIFNVEFKYQQYLITGRTKCLGLGRAEVGAYAAQVDLSKDMLDCIVEFHTHPEYRNDKLRLASYLRTQLLLAITLLHETAHAVQFIFHGSAKDPYFDDDTFAEVGWAWESRAVGGGIRPVEDYLNCIAGLYMESCPSWWPWQLVVDAAAKIGLGVPLRGPMDEMTAYAIVGEKIHELFTDEYWDISGPITTISFREEPIDIHDRRGTRQTTAGGRYIPMEAEDS